LEELDRFLSSSVVFDSPIEGKLVDDFFETYEVLFIFFNENEELSLFKKFGIGCHRLIGPDAKLYLCVRFELYWPVSRLL
jgi:hypothetical protein